MLSSGYHRKMSSYVYHIPPLVRESSRKKPARRRREPTPSFQPETIDTFCFHWPALHSFVLVRVLDSSIALLPIRSRRAFLYFHHAPLPHTPETYARPSADRHRRPSRIHAMLHSWKHTLVLPEDDHLDETRLSTRYTIHKNNDNDNDNNLQSIQQKQQKQQRRPRQLKQRHQHHEKEQKHGDAPVKPLTLQDVLSSEPVHQGWIHAECSVVTDPSNPERGVILTSAKTRLALTARSPVEQRMFLNLVRLKHSRIVQPPHRLSLDKDSDESDATTLM